MKRQVVGAIVAGLLATAACSSTSSSSGPPPSPPRPTTSISPAAVAVIRAYGSTINQALPQVTALSARLTRCTSGTAACAHDATAARSVAGVLLQHLGKDDELRQTTTSGVLAPYVSPVVILSETDAHAVRRTAGSITAHSSKADFAKLATQVSRLATEMKRWRLVTIPAG